jgi:hypothetical protein
MLHKGSRPHGQHDFIVQHTLAIRIHNRQAHPIAQPIQTNRNPIGFRWQ